MLASARGIISCAITNSDGILPRLAGDADAYLGYPARGASIFKIGVSQSPSSRCDYFEKAMPRGAFKWGIERTTRQDGHDPYIDHSVAVVGETEMKKTLAQTAEHLGGEFYLATEEQINAAWKAGRKAARSHEKDVNRG